jgi:hypothetical protein
MFIRRARSLHWVIAEEGDITISGKSFFAETTRLLNLDTLHDIPDPVTIPHLLLGTSIGWSRPQPRLRRPA